MPEQAMARRRAEGGGRGARPWTAAGLAVVAVLICATAARADWLVLRDGSRVETDGGWSIKGKLVVFSDAGGTLSSLRLSEVDLDASAQATADAERVVVAPPAPPVEKRKAVLVLTDADIHKATPEPAAEDTAGAAGGDAEGASKEGAGSAGGAGLEVSSWQQVQAPDGSGLQIYGTLTNKSGNTATNLALKVHLYDAEGKELASADAQIGRAALPPGAQANFTAAFPGLFSFAAAKFEPSFRSFETRALPKPGAAAPGGTGASEAAGSSAGGSAEGAAPPAGTAAPDGTAPAEGQDSSSGAAEDTAAPDDSSMPADEAPPPQPDAPPSN
jgi:hypothetical protein